MEKTRKYIKHLLPVLLPVFFMYLHFSMTPIHSHIFANGETVTHSHSYQDSLKNSTNESKNESKKQVVVFYGLTLNLDNTISETQYSGLCTTFYTRIILPETEMYYTSCFSEKTGRAPPAAYL